MPDANDITRSSGEPPFEPQRLLQDLKAMPRISAPMDFSTHLARAIAQSESAPVPPWWKRFFLPEVEGGFRIPGLAYGAVGLMVVLFFSVYVFQVTDFERDLRKETQPDTPAEETAPELDPENSMESDLELRSIDSNSPDPVVAPTADESEAPAVTPTEQPAAKPAEQPRARTEAPPSAPPAQPKQVEATDDLEHNIRGFFEAEKKPAMDSARSDSLRTLDSLRRLRVESPDVPPQNPR